MAGELSFIYLIFHTGACWDVRSVCAPGPDSGCTQCGTVDDVPPCSLAACVAVHAVSSNSSLAGSGTALCEWTPTRKTSWPSRHRPVRHRSAWSMKDGGNGAHTGSPQLSRGLFVSIILEAYISPNHRRTGELMSLPLRVRIPNFSIHFSGSEASH